MKVTLGDYTVMKEAGERMLKSSKLLVGIAVPVLIILEMLVQYILPENQVLPYLLLVPLAAIFYVFFKEIRRGNMDLAVLLLLGFLTFSVIRIF